MSIILSVLASFLGFIFYLFFVWKKLKEDYESSHIFTVSLLTLFGVICGSLFTHFFIFPQIQNFIPKDFLNLNEAWFWGGVGGFIVAFFISAGRANFKLSETFEPIFVGLLVWSVFLSIAALDLIIFVIGSVFIMFYFALSSTYKKLSWYKSGKAGFAGLTTAGFLFLARSLLALSNLHMISFIGKFDAVLSASIAFVIFFAIYNLAELNK